MRFLPPTTIVLHLRPPDYWPGRENKGVEQGFQSRLNMAEPANRQRSHRPNSFIQSVQIEGANDGQPWGSAGGVSPVQGNPASPVASGAGVPRGGE
jgi:hypothetical protein